MLAAGIDIKIVSDTLGRSDTRSRATSTRACSPHVRKSAAEATTKLVPLQRKSEEDKARTAAKKAKRREGEGQGEEEGPVQEGCP
ncbi:hypothetical protein ABZ934_26690 [Streptomyces sp. NPDC046557]|uniref:hypothetical protein n=1 Tax=Streptomyces sp. NPDC046557 TaxID=3155372 RepID=UPI0033E24EBB